MGFSIDFIYRIINKYTSPLAMMQRGTAQFRKDLKRGQKDLAKFQQGISRFTTGAAIGGMAALGGSVAFMIKEASKIENVTAAFTPLMGSAEKATELVNRLNTEAATTPFQFENISKTATQLLPLMAGDINRVADTFRMLGDTAGGNAQKLDSITRGYSKVLGKGKADMEALNMITEAGVPIMDQLSKKYGVSINQLYKMSAAGKITEKMVTDTFKSMTGEGGIFFKGMEISSKTFSGLMSTLKDNISLAAAGIGSTMLPIMKNYVKVAIEAAGKLRTWVENNKELIEMKVKGYVETIKKLGKFVFNVAKGFWAIAKALKPFLPMIIGVIVAFKTYRMVMVAVAAVQALVAATNPVTAIIVGVGVLIGLVYILYRNWVKVKEILKVVAKYAAALLMPLGPIMAALGMLVSTTQSLLENWKYIKIAFTDKGIGAGLIAIGKALVGGLLAPLQTILEVASKIPKIGKWAKEGADKIKNFRENLFPKEAEKQLETVGKKTQDTIKKTRQEAIKPIDLSKITGLQDANFKSVLAYKESQLKAKDQFAFTERYVSKPADTVKMPERDTTVNANMNLRVYNETSAKIEPFNSNSNLGVNKVGR